MTPALFLDRDGVINIEKNYLYRIEDFEFIDGVFESCKYFQNLGYKIIVVTNQAGIARGYYSVDDFEKLTEWMLGKFLEQGISITEVYYCPHHPNFSVECACRKPKAGMLLEAAKNHDINLTSSIMVGDKKSDMMAAKSAGISNRILVRSGHQITKNDEVTSSLVIDSIRELIKYYG